MPSLGMELGSLLVATWVETALYVVVILLVYQYFRDYPHDSALLKALVVTALTLDTARTFGDYCLVYLYTVKHWGESAYLRVLPWPLVMSSFCASTLACLIQAFLIYRYYRFAKKLPVTVLLGVMTGATYGAALATTVINGAPEGKYPPSNLLAVTLLWLIGSAATDIAIAFCLVQQLRKLQAFIGSTTRTRVLIRRLSTMAVETGCTTASVALVSAIIFNFRAKEGNVSLGISFAYGPAYTLTMLFNLNNRRSVRMTQDAHSLGRVVSGEFEDGERRAQSSSGRIQGIRDYLGVGGRGNAQGGSREHKRGSLSASMDGARQLDIIYPAQPEPIAAKVRRSQSYAPSTALRVQKRDSVDTLHSMAYEV